MRSVFVASFLLLVVPPAFAGACHVGEKAGWIPVDVMPQDAAKILASAKPDDRDLLISSPTVEWFRNEDGAYLACIPAERSYCGQVNYHIQKKGDGWAAPFHYVVNCG